MTGGQRLDPIGAGNNGEERLIMAKQTATKSITQETTIHVEPLRQARIRLRIIGTTPMFQHRMAAKAMRSLLIGGAKKTAAEKKNIKHHPHEEFLEAAEILSSGPTALGLRMVAVKSAMYTAALETNGMTKTGAQRLLFLPGDHAALYGTPQLRMDIVRSADMAKTPDVRTRPFLPKWGAEIDIAYIEPQLNAGSVVSLLCNGGVLVGLGDFRQEKGKGNFGCFRVIGPGEVDAEWDDLVKNHGREAQAEALENPQPANDETRELLEFYQGEVKRRASTTTTTKTKGDAS